MKKFCPQKAELRRSTRWKARILAAILSAALLAGCTAPGRVSQQSRSSKLAASSEAHHLSTISLSYAMNRSMNPFTVDSELNYNLMPLVYDSLVAIDNQLTPQMRLATAVTVQGTQVFITLRSGVQFSDGHALTPVDVAYSINFLLQRHAAVYTPRLVNIASVAPNGADGVLLKLKTPDPLAANLLDLPIVENGSAGSTHPVGSGRYMYKTVGNTTVLTWNKKWYGYGSSQPAVRTIDLLNMPDDTAASNSLNIGMVDYGMADTGGSPSTVMNKATSQMNLNQILYIGVNHQNGALKDPHVRRAVSALIDRKTLVSSVYASLAKPAVLPLNPLYPGTPKTSAADLDTLTNVATAQLVQAGYTGKNAVGALQNTKNPKLSLSFTLLVNKSASQSTAIAQKLADSLQSAGILIKVKAVDKATMVALLKRGQFDLYVGEIKLPADLDLAQLFASGGSASYGQPKTSATYAAYAKYRNGQGTLASVAQAFQTEMPFLPLCFRMGTTAYQSGFCGNILATYHDIFYNIQDWK